MIEENKRLRSELGKLRKGDRDAVIGCARGWRRRGRRARARRLGGGRERTRAGSASSPRRSATVSRAVPPPSSSAGDRTGRRSWSPPSTAEAVAKGVTAPELLREAASGDRRRRGRQGHPRDGRRPGRVRRRGRRSAGSPRAPASSSRLPRVTRSPRTRARPRARSRRRADRGRDLRPTIGVSRCPSAPCTSVSRPASSLAIAELVRERGATLIVVGLPLSLRGERGTRAGHADAFAQALAGVVEVPDRAAGRAAVDGGGGASARGGGDPRPGAPPRRRRLRGGRDPPVLARRAGAQRLKVGTPGILAVMSADPSLRRAGRGSRPRRLSLVIALVLFLGVDRCRGVGGQPLPHLPGSRTRAPAVRRHSPWRRTHRPAR